MQLLKAEHTFYSSCFWPASKWRIFILTHDAHLSLWKLINCVLKNCPSVEMTLQIICPQLNILFLRFQLWYRSDNLFRFLDVKSSICRLHHPLTLPVILLSHQLIKPGDFTPPAMLGPAASQRCPGRSADVQRARASDPGCKSQGEGGAPKCSLRRAVIRRRDGKALSTCQSEPGNEGSEPDFQWRLVIKNTVDGVLTNL